MSSSSSTPLSVVVADDEPAMLSLVASHMKRLGFTVHEAPDGAAAWKLVQEQLPDLVMLDVMMPEMSGWEVARAIKSRGAAGGALGHTPVLMLTGIGERLNAMNSPLFAADGWLDKPFEFAALDEKIAEVLEKHGKQMPPRPNSAGAGGTDKPAKAAAKKASATKASAKKTGTTKKPATKKPAAVKEAPAKKAAATAPAAKKAPAKAAAPAKKAAPVKTASKPAKKSASKAAVKTAAKSPAKKSGSTRRA